MAIRLIGLRCEAALGTSGWGCGRILPTVRLTLQTSAAGFVDPTVHAVCGQQCGGLVGAHGATLDNGVPVGHYMASFDVSRPRPSDAALPWEWEPAEAPVAPDDYELTHEESDIVRTVTQHAATAAPTGGERLGVAPPWIDRLLDSSCAPVASDAGALCLVPNSAMRNRAGFVQGAVLFGIALRTVEQLIASTGRAATMGYADIAFVAAAQAQLPVTTVVRLTRQTRMASFVTCDVEQDGHPVAQASFVHTSQPPDDR